MKKLCLLLLIAVLLQACCKVACLDAQLDISFQNFKRKDTDSVQVVSYRKDTRQAIDSLWLLSSIMANDTLPSALHTTLLPGKDWELRIPKLAKIYYFSHFEVQQAKCECGGSRTTRLISYKLNENIRHGYLLILE